MLPTASDISQCSRTVLAQGQIAENALEENLSHKQKTCNARFCSSNSYHWATNTFLDLKLSTEFVNIQQLYN